MSSAPATPPPPPSLLYGITKLFGQAGAALVAEQMLMKMLPQGGLMAATQLTVPKFYGMLFVTNAFLPSCIMLYLGFGIVSPARKKYKVDYPTMYAVSQKEGDDAYKFNCCQRAHQQALETLPLFLLTSFLGGLKHPLLVALSGLLWCIARVKWAQGYATGVPSNRYSNFWGYHIWTSVAIPMLCCLSAGIQIMMG